MADHKTPKFVRSGGTGPKPEKGTQPASPALRGGSLNNDNPRTIPAPNSMTTRRG